MIDYFLCNRIHSLALRSQSSLHIRNYHSQKYQHWARPQNILWNFCKEQNLLHSDLHIQFSSSSLPELIDLYFFRFDGIQHFLIKTSKVTFLNSSPVVFLSNSGYAHNFISECSVPMFILIFVKLIRSMFWHLLLDKWQSGLSVFDMRIFRQTDWDCLNNSSAREGQAAWLSE